MKFLIFVMFLSGCSASMVSTRGNDTSAVAPINEAANKGGVIKYLNQGADSVIKSRRHDAYVQMHDYCAGDYSITREGQQPDGSAAMPLGDMTYYASQQYWYIAFKCVVMARK